MSINCPVKMARLTCDEMRRLDYQVMAHAFASQNELGRLCDESVYQADLVARLTAAGLGPVLFEQPIQVTHLDQHESSRRTVRHADERLRNTLLAGRFSGKKMKNRHPSYFDSRCDQKV